MAARVLEDLEDFVREKVEKDKWTLTWLSEYLRGRYPETRGFSVRTIERFCSTKGIHRTSRLGTDDLDKTVAEAVNMVHSILFPVGAAAMFSTGHVHCFLVEVSFVKG